MAKILDVKIDELSMNEVRTKIIDLLNKDGLSQIVTVNPEFLLEARKNKIFKDVLNSAEISVPDGFGLKIASFLKRQKIKERFTGVDLTWELAKIASEFGYTMFFLGAKEGIAEKTAERLKLVYPNLKIAGYYSGSPDDPKVFEILAKAKPDILLVAFGAPKQDIFISNLKSSFSKFMPKGEFRISDLPKIAMGVGGTFDYISETVPRAPKFMRILGLEWLFRVTIQPSRLKRIIRAVILFPLTVLFSRR